MPLDGDNKQLIGGVLVFVGFVGFMFLLGTLLKLLLVGLVGIALLGIGVMGLAVLTGREHELKEYVKRKTQS